MRQCRPPVRRSWRSLLTATSALIVTLAAVGTAQAGETIDVQGNRRIDTETVRSYFHAGPDGQFDEAARDAALKALLETRLFDKVTIERAGERLIVHLVEAPVLDRIAFEGNKKIQDKDLTAVIEFKSRGPLQRAVVQADVGRIIEAYRHVGRDEVAVVPQIISHGSDRVDLIYVVTEGAKTTVRQINFEGNKVFGKRQLTAVIKTSATNMLSFLTGGDNYDPDRVDADREQLRLYYRSKGYADASVPSAKAEYDPATHGYTLTFSIDEGPLYHFGDINIVCNVPGLNSEKLRGLLLTRSGAAFDGNALDKTSDVLTAELAKLGFPFAQALARTTRNDAATRIDVTFTVDQGPRTYVERIEIHGNTRTRGYVIRREFDLSEGDAYNKTLIDRAERRLKQLNYFKTVKISSKPGSAQDRVVLDVEVDGTVDRRFYDFRWLLDNRWPARRDQGGRPQFPGQRQSRQLLRNPWSIRERGRPVGIGALFPRHARFGRHRSLRQAKLREFLPVLWQQHLWRDAAVGHADQRATRRAVSLFHL